MVFLKILPLLIPLLIFLLPILVRTYLKSKFPNNIRQFNVYKDEKIIAGTTVFESDFVAHSQYISADESKNSTGGI